MSFHNFVTQKLGIDKAIFYTLLGRGLQISTAALTVVFIIRFLSPVEQGYYYTFGSIVAIQVFFELGLTGIITQFVAHEASHLQIDAESIKGDEYYKSRLASLLKICAKWYSMISIGMLVVLVTVGFIFFNKYGENHHNTDWVGGWITLAIGTVLNFLVTPIVSFIEGLGKVREIAKFRMIQQIVQPFVLWGGLWLGFKLYVPGLDALFRVLIMSVLIYYSPISKILKKVWRQKIIDRVSYRNEIFPYQWRIAVSWISGYFIFQLFNPVLFATEGPKVAGQMGMTMQALNALQALTLAWMHTKVPQISGLIALRKYCDLDKIFIKTFKQIMLLGGSVLAVFVVTIILFQNMDITLFGLSVGDRFLPTFALVLMGCSTYTMFPVNCWAIYLRSHKREPLMVNSVVMGILCCMSTFILGHIYGLYGIVIGFFMLRMVSLSWVYKVFRNKKTAWHAS